MQRPQSGRSSGGKGQACAHYFLALDQAKKSFKMLTDNALLKCWEFTVASFAETKATFSRWNLYSSLGFRAEEPGGIGGCLYETINSKVQACNREVEEFHEQYSYLYLVVREIESRMRHAASEEELRWVRADYQAKSAELATLQQLRDEAQMRARHYANLFQHLIDTYLALFPSYFQEVYDAEMMDVSGSIYDDSPAGFRLLYKHGRTNTAMWSWITNTQEFVEMLASFFMAAEREIEHQELFKGIEKELAEVTSVIVNHVRTEKFFGDRF